MVDFMGIGAQKAGTTWLYRMLEMHPRVAFPRGKEAHFWNRPTEHDATAYFDAFATAGPDLRQGDFTPAYALLDIDAIRRIHATNPAMRLIFLMRNPIERAWSAALMALQRAELEFGDVSETWFMEHFRSSGSRSRGDYELTLRRWRAVFPKEQLLLLRYEDVCAAPRGLLGRCARHLHVSDQPFADLPDSVVAERVFAGPGQRLSSTLRAELMRLYRPRIMALAAYLEEDLDHWLAP